MREIKFRAWDRKGKRMWRSETDPFSVAWDGQIYATSHYKEEAFDMENAAFAVMQYTGLKDKTGKEIYEGDIVKVDKYWHEVVFWLPQCSRFCQFYVKDPSRVTNTEWLKEHWIKIANKSTVPGFADAEVIGNIYENPDLLK